MKYRFTAEDFAEPDNLTKSFLDPQDRALAEAMAHFCAEKANTLLAKWEGEGMKVHLSFTEMEGHNEFIASSVPQGNETHEATLWCPRKIGEE